MHRPCEAFSHLLNAVRETAWQSTAADCSATLFTVYRQPCEGMWIGGVGKGASATVAMLTACSDLGTDAGG